MKNIALYLVRNDENLERTKSTLSLLANHEHLIHLLQGNWHKKKKKTKRKFEAIWASPRPRSCFLGEKTRRARS